MFKCSTVSVSFSACKCSSVVVSSKVGRGKKKSLETVLWMAICGCGSPAHCCQPVVAGSVIYADLRSELNTHLAPQALFTQSSPVHKPLLQAFPFPRTLREVTLHLLSPASLFTYSSRGKWSSPLSCGVFFPPLLLQAFPLLIAGCVLLLLPSLAWLVYLQLTWEVVFPSLLCSFLPSATFTSFPTPDYWACAAAPAFSSRLVRDFPSSPSVLRALRPLCYMSFLFSLLTIQFLFSPWVGVSLSRGLCWSGPGLSVGVPHIT
jgi:hypothetical protein